VQGKLYECLKCKDSSLSQIRVVDSEFEIDQLIGGTHGTDYIYVYVGGSFINVRYLNGCRVIAREEWGGKRYKETYRISRDTLDGKLLLHISYSNKGYVLPRVCIIENNVVKCCDCPPLERDDEFIMQIASSFKPLGKEVELLKLYLDLVPRLSREILDTVKRSGAREISFAGKAERFKETMYSPGLSLFTTMSLTSEGGRVKSLLVKISHIAELAIIARIVKAMDGVSLTDNWWIEFVWNKPLTIVKSKITGKEYTILYQPSILPPIIRMIEPSAPAHMIPDVVVFEGRFENIEPGRLHKLLESGNRPLLAVEVKTGLKFVKWEQSDYIINQVKTYRELLNPKNFALVSLRGIDPLLKVDLKSLGIAVFENITNESVQKEFENYVLRAITLTT
jgi:hypothetical protein